MKLYVSEAHSDRARQEAARAGQIICTPLQALELQSAIRQLVGRGTLSASALTQFERHFDSDVKEQRVVEKNIDLARAFRRADQLTRTYTERLLCRTLDVLHVATALELDDQRFVSADDRQLALAKAAGLAATDIKA